MFYKKSKHEGELMLVAQNLHKSFQKTSVLQGVSFALKKGEIAIFLGDSGAGKSTLLRILSGLETLDEGECFLDGYPVKAKNSLIGLVFQQYHLFEHLNMEENITLALMLKQKKDKGEAIKIAEYWLSRYGLFEKRYESVQVLSGGQKQRLALARTLALNPEVLCLDEPTSALDPKLRTSVVECIIELAQEGKTLLLTTHDMALVSRLPATVFFMKSGKITEQGSYKEIQQHPDRYPCIHQFIA